MKKIIVMVSSITLLAGNARADFQASVRFSDFQSLIARTVLWNDSAKAFVLAENEKLLGWGFGSSFFTIGSIRLSGLLRELENPMGYQAASSVFTEKTQIALAPSFQKNPRTGLEISFFGDILNLYIIQKEDEKSMAGLFLKYSFIPDITQELILDMSIVPEKPETGWFYNGLPRIPGVIGSAMHRLAFTGKGFRIVSDIALSAPENAQVGWFGAVSGSLSISSLRLLTMLCLKSEGYAATTGTLQEEALVCSLNADMAFLKHFVLGLNYRKSVPHKVPVESAFWEGNETFGASLDIYMPDSFVSYPVCKLGYSGKRSGGPLVLSRDRESCTLSITPLAFDWMRLTASGKVMWERDIVSGTTDVSLEFKVGLVRGNISYAIDLDEDGVFHSGSALLQIDMGNWSVFVKSQTRKSVSIDEIAVPAGEKDTLDLLVFSFGGDLTI
ncbi:MAG: hypothetical protein EHM28_05460 [Spirochaetaceae bacterium]|nr:MAG: hypothetical protein EHM28_05460 [Spirochaetaceae bacterium]